MFSLDDSTKAMLGFIGLVFLFPLFYLFVPLYIAYVINVIVVIISSYMLWKREQKHLVLVCAIFFALNTYFLIKNIANLQLLTLDYVEYLRVASLALVIDRFIEYLPLLMLFMIAFAVFYVIVFFTNRGSNQYKWAIFIGYLGIIVVIVLIFIDITGIIDPAESMFTIVIFGSPIVLGMEIYYFIDISTWIMSSFSFIATLLALISGD